MESIYTTDSFIDEIKKHHETHREQELSDLNAKFPDEYWEKVRGISLKNCMLSVKDYFNIKNNNLELREESKVIFDLLNIFYIYNNFLAIWGDIYSVKLSPMEILNRFGFNTPVSIVVKPLNTDVGEFCRPRDINNSDYPNKVLYKHYQQDVPHNYFYQISPSMYYVHKKFANICQHNPEKSWIRNYNHRINQIQRVKDIRKTIEVDNGNEKYGYSIPVLSKHNKNTFVYSLMYMNSWIKNQPVKWLYPFGLPFEAAIHQRILCDRIKCKQDDGTWSQPELIVNADFNPCVFDRAVNYWYLVCAAYYYHDIHTADEFISISTYNKGECRSTWGVNSNMNTLLKYGDRLFHAEL